MTGVRVTESIVEEATLSWLEGLGYTTLHGPDIAPEESNAERENYSEVVLALRLSNALSKLNPDLPSSALEDAFRQAQFVRLAEGIELLVQGQPADGGWKPAETPINGRGSEGFFVYMLEFAFDQRPDLASPLELEIRNDLYPGSEILFANYLRAEDGWAVVEASTPQPPPGADLSFGSEDEMAMWSDDESRRRFQATVRRVNAPP